MALRAIFPLFRDCPTEEGEGGFKRNKEDSLNKPHMSVNYLSESS